ncbi:diguanylate cyclase [Tardiphaga sp. 768_D3_N2_1]|uniref:sensor domain-containing diguanylate cyclase n=1 Tax=Tardiphaga sp. 768_D3_N2_1 TaxID=3240783 RepID=UPI003F88E19A
MTVPTTPTSSSPSRLSAPGVIVTLFVLAMSACVLGLVVWKALDARQTVLAQSETDTRNLAHSLVEHASHTIQAVDVAMSGMADLLKYQNPQPDRFNTFLANTANALPQLRELGVFDTLGNWRYSSLPETPTHNNSDRDYFIYHRDHADSSIRVNTPITSRLTGRPSIILSKRISGPDGSFKGVLTGAIDTRYFGDFYKTFQIGESGGISLIRSDGTLLIHWPSMEVGKDLSGTQLIQTRLKQSLAGFYKIDSPFDGIAKYFSYEQTTQYPLIVTVAIPEDQVLATWKSNLLSDVIVASVLLCTVILLAALLSTQFRFRLNMENALRERESRYRLLADNIADVIILLDRFGNIVFVSHSVELVLGHSPKDLLGRSCFELVHPDDIEAVKAASAQLKDLTANRTVIFRTYRDDQSLAWVEVNFKLATREIDRDKVEIVGVLRDVTLRKSMQDELTALNSKLAELATTDGLTGLANRRTFDSFLHRAYEQHEQMSMLLIDVDNFKGYNDSNGHQAGDDCLKRVAAVIADATINTPALSARYGGEEFAIVLPDVSEADAITIAEALRLRVRALEIPNMASSRSHLSISVGVASRNSQTSNEAVLVGEADLALYEAKRRGRDSVVANSALQREYFSAGFSHNG